MGNLKKFENVCASKTSLTDVAINNPMKVDAMEIRITARIMKDKFISEEFIKKVATMNGTKAFAIPKMIAPRVFANIIRLKGKGESKILSKVLLFFSKVMVTESMDVVPKSMDMAIMPGSIDMISIILPPVLIKNMPAHAKGNMIPQLIFGGFK